MKQLVPVAEQLSPTLIALSKFAPQAKGFFEGLEPVIARAPTGFPALRKLFRDQFPPLLRAVDPFLRNLNPILTGLDLYKHELTATMANIAAISNAKLPDRKRRRRTGPLPARDGPVQPGIAGDLPEPHHDQPHQRLPAAACRQEPRHGPAQLRYPTAAAPGSPRRSIPKRSTTRPSKRERTEAEQEDAPKKTKNCSKTFFENLKKFAFAGRPTPPRSRRPRLHPASALQPDGPPRRADDLPAQSSNRANRRRPPCEGDSSPGICTGASCDGADRLVCLRAAARLPPRLGP